MNILGLETEYPAVKLCTIRILTDGKPVKYGEGSDSYEGFKQKAVCLTGEEFPPTVNVHSKENLKVGVYSLIVEVVPESKFKTRNHFVFDQDATNKLSQKKVA